VAPFGTKAATAQLLTQSLARLCNCDLEFPTETLTHLSDRIVIVTTHVG
jgi:hypothetical protein